MRRIFLSVLLASVPALMMLQVLQAYRYVVASEEIGALESQQVERLEENNRILAGIAVFDSPERVYGVAIDSLGLEKAASENILQVRFPDGAGVAP